MTKFKLIACVKCEIPLKSYWLKDGMCGGCRNPDLIVESMPKITEDEFKKLLTRLYPDIAMDLKHRTSLVGIVKDVAIYLFKYDDALDNSQSSVKEVYQHQQDIRELRRQLISLDDNGHFDFNE